MPETEETLETAETPVVTITPTVGRVVHFYKNSGAKPLIGLIASVESDTKVNLACFDVNGVPYAYGQKGVTLLQGDDKVPAKGSWCEWMPYQKQVAGGGSLESVDLKPVSINDVNGLSDLLNKLRSDLQADSAKTLADFKAEIEGLLESAPAEAKAPADAKPVKAK